MRTILRTKALLITALAGLVAAQGKPEPPPSAASLVTKLWKAQSELAYRGTQVYAFEFAEGRGSQREAVAVRPSGPGTVDFSLELVAFIERRHAQDDFVPSETLARALFSRWAGSQFQHRGFRIQNPDLALLNYSFRSIGRTQVAGREVDTWVVLPRLMDRRLWVIWVDRETGLVLRHHEHSPQGVRLSSLEFEAKGLQIGPGTSFHGVDWWESSQSEVRRFPNLPIAEMVFGERARVPSYLPPGYMLVDVRITTDAAGDSFLVLNYSDGIDRLFLINGPSPVTAGLPALPDSVQSEMIVHRFTFGSLVQLWTQVDGRLVMLMGRLPGKQIPLTFESMLTVPGR